MSSGFHSKTRVWQRMLSGRRLDLLDPSPLDIEIEDIAHGLARVARWNGQTKGDFSFSVAQHCVLVLEIAKTLSPDLSSQGQLATLLHDASEYVIGDMISPFKAVMGGDYKQIEKRLLVAIHIRFSLPPTLPLKLAKLIKRSDQIAAFFEATQLAGFSYDEAKRFFTPPSGMNLDTSFLIPLSACAAQATFLKYFEAASEVSFPKDEGEAKETLLSSKNNPYAA